MGELVPRGWFSNVGAPTAPLKLAVAGTQDWWRRFPPLLVTDSIWLERAGSLITKR